MTNKIFSAYRKGVDLTLKQRAFVTTLVRHGCNPTQTARQAGYVEPKVASYDLLRTPHIQEAIRQERARYISGDLANIATGTLRAIMTDENAPASARVAAARTALELAGELGSSKREYHEDGPLSEMTADQLAQLIDKWQGDRMALASSVEVVEIDVTDVSGNAHLLQ
jgi:hypothetical protein